MSVRNYHVSFNVPDATAPYGERGDYRCVMATGPVAAKSVVIAAVPNAIRLDADAHRNTLPGHVHRPVTVGEWTDHIESGGCPTCR